MRWLRRLLVFAGVLSGLWYCRGWVFRNVVHYHIVGVRGEVEPVQSAPGPIDGIDEAIDLALDTTAAWLHFSTGRVSNDLHKLNAGSPANCVGYAKLCAALVQDHVVRSGIGGRFVVEPVVAKLFIGDFDIHGLSRDPFWKDHDVVRVRELDGDRVIYFDPTLYDVVGIDRIRGIEHGR